MLLRFLDGDIGPTAFADLDYLHQVIDGEVQGFVGVVPDLLLVHALF